MTFKEIGMKRDICPVCEAEREIKIGLKKETLAINNELMEIEARVEYCATCKEFFADVEAEEKNIQKAYRAYRQTHDLLQPEEIREIRERYGISQRAFSRLLGWGEITLHRYESGALQDEAHNNELLLMKDPDNFRLLFERGQDKLAPHLVRQIEKRLVELSSEKHQDWFKKYLESFFDFARIDIYSGFKHFDLEKFESAIMFFARHPDGVLKTKLNKLVWYFDFLCFKKLGVSATGTIYIHLPYGPVPKNYNFFLHKSVSEEALLMEEKIFDKARDIIGEIYLAAEEPDLSFLTVEERQCLEQVDKHFQNLNAAEISRYSHEEAGYQNTKDGDMISYEWAKDLKI